MYETGSNHGFLVRDAAENADAEQQFNSREKGENQPQLLLTFAAPPGPDTVAPETAIGAKPPDLSYEPDASFDFSADEEGATFECKLDDGDYGACTPPVSYAALAEGVHTFSVRATDPAGNTDQTPAQHTWTVAEPPPQLPTSQAPQGTWFPSFGAGGYALGGWNGSSDLVALPAGARLVVEQGGRTRWSSSTSNVRALQGPGGTGRRAAAWSHAGELRLRIDFAAAWSGDLHLYALDWDNRGRRQVVTVDDGSGPRVAVLDSSFANGLWTRAPVAVPAGGSVRITVSHSAGTSAVLSGLFLGGAP
jgi:hypothetical protein